MSERLSLRAYARRRKERGLRGGTLRSVQRAIETARIVDAVDPVTGLIDPAHADRLWAENTTPVVMPEPEPIEPRPAPHGIEKLAQAMAADGWGVAVVPRGNASVGAVLRRIVDALPANLPGVEEIIVFDPDGDEVT